MTVEQDELLMELYVLVQEQGHIWEALGPLTGQPGTERQDCHAGWKQTDCAQVLRTWHEAGLLGLYRDGPNSTIVDLDASAVARVLTMSETWVPDTAHELLFSTRDGNEQPFDEWRAALMPQAI